MKYQDVSNATSQLPEDLGSWLDYFDRLHSKTIDLGLERIARVAKRCELRQLPGKVILVAGTNGKGTTCAFLENTLLALGYTTGVFSSPHIVHYNECVRINGKVLSNERHCEAFAYIECQRQQTSLTPFEFSTLAAFKLIKDANVDFAIIEVGMGGRGDSTNVVEPDISVLTTINIDHQAFLGDDRAAIGYEKAGIMRKGKPVVIGELNVPATVRHYAEHIQAQPYFAQIDYYYTQYDGLWDWRSLSCDLKRLPLPGIPVQNVATGLKVLQLLDIKLNESLLAQILQSLKVTGRFEQISHAPRVIIDVAHNVEAAKYLAERLERLDCSKVTAVCGMLKDKDIDGTLATIAPWIDIWLPATLPTQRGANAQVICKALEKQGIRPHKAFDNVMSALTEAKRQWREGELIVVFGSFVTIAQILQDEKL